MQLSRYLPLVACAALTLSQASAQQPVDWQLGQLDRIGGHPTSVLGNPRVIEEAQVHAIEFDGQDDGILLPTNPLAGLQEFTVEVIFRPTADGPREQRFVHFQEEGTDNRLLFEIRLREEGRWFLDSFLKTGSGNHTLYAENSLHPIGSWYHAAVVIDGQAMRHYVNGQEELSATINMQPLKPGRSSLGVRLNQVSWYRGAIRQIRITPRALAPADFLKP
jgi:hypothetical protein